MSKDNGSTGEWQFQGAGAEQGGAFKVLVHQGVPVIVRRAGTYWDARSDEQSTKTAAHIVISIGWGAINGVVYYGDCDVSVIGARPTVADSRKVMPVKKMRFEPELHEKTPDHSIAVGMSHLDEAVKVLLSLDETFQKAKDQLAFLDGVAAILERSEYERLCEANGVKRRSDADCSSYGVQHGVFSFPEHDVGTIAEMEMARRRLRGVEREQAGNGAGLEVADREAGQETKKEGQLWEACEKCGAEPVYMPLHLCARCWPKPKCA